MGASDQGRQHQAGVGVLFDTPRFVRNLEKQFLALEAAQYVSTGKPIQARRWRWRPALNGNESRKRSATA